MDTGNSNVIFETKAKNNSWQDVEDFRIMWGKLHPEVEDKLIELSRKDLIDICLSAMSGMATIKDTEKAVKRIKNYL